MILIIIKLDEILINQYFSQIIYLNYHSLIIYHHLIIPFLH